MNDSDLAAVLGTSLAQGGFERDDLYLFDTPLAWIMTNEAHVSENERKIVIEAMSACADIRELLDCSLNVGDRGISVTSEALCSWLLNRTKQVGGIEAVSDLRQFISQPFCPVDEILAISGLVVEQSIRLSSDIELVPFSALQESQITIALSDPRWENFARCETGRIRRRKVVVLASVGRAEHHSDPLLPTAALRISHRVVPKINKVAAADAQLSKLELMHAVLNVASVTACAPVFPVAYWWAPSPIVPCGDFGTPYLFWNHAKGLHRVTYAEQIRSRLVDAIGLYVASDDTHRQRMKIPLERFNAAMTAMSPVDCAIDMGIALEALLLADLGASDQPTLMFRLRGAWLLGRSADEREKLWHEFAALYECRSKAVHTGKLPDVVKIDGVKTSAADFLEGRGRSLAATAILQLLQSPTAGWTRTILGDQ